MRCYREARFTPTSWSRMALGSILSAILIFRMPAVQGAEVAAPSAGTPLSGTQELPYAPPPMLGFGELICAPVRTCAPPVRDPVKGQSEQQRLLYEQTRPHTPVEFKPADFDKYAGYYEFDFSDGTVFTRIYRDSDRYYWQVETAGQPATEVFPAGTAEFFATENARQLSFDTDSHGHVTNLVLHEDGVVHMAHPVPEATYETWLTSLRQRILANEPSAGTQEALRRQLETWKKMLAENTAPQEPILKRMQVLGDFQDLMFVKVGPRGQNVFVAKFSRGDLKCFVAPLSPDGKVNGLECN
jgi:hypothetical protein